VIIYDGRLVMYSLMDTNTELPLAYVDKGAVINPHNFLSGSRGDVNMKCLTTVTYYYLPYQKLRKLAAVYPTLRTSLQKA